jgi:hypothetical protein
MPSESATVSRRGHEADDERMGGEVSGRAGAAITGDEDDDDDEDEDEEEDDDDEDDDDETDSDSVAAAGSDGDSDDVWNGKPIPAVHAIKSSEAVCMTVGKVASSMALARI